MPPNRTRCATTVALLAALPLTLVGVVATPLGAQVVRGTVTEIGSKAPLPGVVVSLEDASGKAMVQVLSNQSGDFELRAPGAGSYTLVVKRIGVRPTRRGPFALATDEGRRETIEVEAVVPSLAAVRVTGRAQCGRAGSGGDERLASLWEDARAALTAARITARGSERGRVTHFSREIDAESGRIVKDERQSRDELLGRVFRSIPADRLEREGYVVRRDDGSIDYYAPDAEILLADDFVASHCFKLVAGERDRARQVGISFEPARGRDLPDITGVLWIDGATLELREVVFTYTSLPSGVPGDPRRDNLGGRVHFARLADGRWIVDDWKIRMPVSVAMTTGSAAARLTMVRDVGGTVDPVRRTASMSERVAASSVSGTVFDSLARTPAAGALVLLEGTPYSAVTGSDGRFAIGDVPQGTYTLSVTTPALDSLGARLPGTMLDISRPGTTIARLYLPSLRQRADRMCRESIDLEKAGAVRLRVIDAATREPVRDLPIRASWRAIGIVGTNVGEVTRDMEVTLDNAGTTTLCGLPGETLVTIEPAVQGVARWRDTLRLAHGELAVRTAVARAVVARAASERTAPTSASGGSTVNVRTRNPTATPTRTSRGGIVIDAELLRSRHIMRVSDALRLASGVRVVSLPRGGFAPATNTVPDHDMQQIIAAWASEGRHPTACYMQVVIDGGRAWTWGPSPPIDIDMWSATTVERIEVYRFAGETPPEYSATGSLCGTVVIKTLRG